MFMPMKRQSYHHGDLSRALVREAVHTIQKDGVDALTLRAVGQKLGVSRTALYRHFADKSALLAAVASEGFRTLAYRLEDAWKTHRGGRKGFEAMGAAYVHFAVEHPSHYRVMFGGFVKGEEPDTELAVEGAAAFQTLVDAIVALQKQGSVRAGDPHRVGAIHLGDRARYRDARHRRPAQAARRRDDPLRQRTDANRVLLAGS